MNGVAPGTAPQRRRDVFVRRRIAVVATVAALILVGLLVTGGGSIANRPRQALSSTTTSSTHYRRQPKGLTPSAYLAPGSDPSVLPGPVLIADKSNNRLIEVSPTGNVLWEFPRPGDLAPGQTFRVPDDAFYTPDGKQIIATQEDDFAVTLIDVATHRIVWRYGTPGQSGAGPNQLWNPDDAIMLRDGRIVLADIKNCRLVWLTTGAHTPVQQLGRTYYCHHRPPARFASPNGAFPVPGGGIVVTEITHDWITELAPDGTVLWQTHAPGVGYPSDTNQIGPDRYLTVDVAHPGKIVAFDHTGRLLWEFRPTGRDTLDRPTLAEALPNGDILATDDDNNRVIVVDPRTNRIVWQYGHTGVDGRAPGYLSDPDGGDLAPPHSLISRVQSAG
ncbi:MAG TPA: PQQ-binding-like beta-propeller repeat protein [Acidimicrobiia bacterium]|nr:PQQ-binding-like beta-propeller repeat protein [Acidimicrobiia bacterium]